MVELVHPDRDGITTISALSERVISAAVDYAELYCEELSARPEGGTSRELLDAVRAFLTATDPTAPPF